MFVRVMNGTDVIHNQKYCTAGAPIVCSFLQIVRAFNLLQAVSPLLLRAIFLPESTSSGIMYVQLQSH